MTLNEFEPFCERYQNGMFRVARSVLGDNGLSEDAVQTALKRIFMVFGKLSFETERQEKVYAMRAAQNAAIDIQRKQTPVVEISKPETERLSYQQGDVTFEQAALGELEGRLADIVRSLSPKAQSIFRYREFGLKDADIAASLGITVSDVRTTVFRARKRVAEHLREEGLYDG